MENNNFKMGLSKDEMDFVIQLLEKRDLSPKITNGTTISKEEIENNKDTVEKFLDVYLFKSQLIGSNEIINSSQIKPDDQNIKCESCEQWKDLVKIHQFFIHSIGRHNDFTGHRYTKDEFKAWEKEHWKDS